MSRDVIDAERALAIRLSARPMVPWQEVGKRLAREVGRPVAYHGINVARAVHRLPRKAIVALKRRNRPPHAQGGG